MLKPRNCTWSVTGLPKHWNAPITDLDNWPRLVQLGWILYDSRDNEIKRANRIFIPEGFIIPPGTSNVHGISTQKAINVGIDLTEVLNEFSKIFNEANFLIAHNSSFDEAIIRTEFLRKDVKSRLIDIPKICKIPGRSGYKWPNLTVSFINFYFRRVLKVLMMPLSM